MLKNLYNIITLNHFRNSLIKGQFEVLKNLEHLKEQQMLKNPFVVVRNVIFKLPLFYVDHIQKSIYQKREFYEIETLNHIKNEFPQIRHVIDIGSNIGNHVLFYCSEMGANQVLCFEPNEFNRSVLIENIKINHLDLNVTVYGCALGSKAGVGVQRDFSISNTGMNRIERVENMPDKQSKVEIRSLDSYNVESVDFLKIDVEGFELEVLKGGIDTLQRCRPIILVEVFDDNLMEVDDFMFKMSYKKLKTLEDYNLIYVPDFN
jgi:FkbM family methyltransferase